MRELTFAKAITIANKNFTQHTLIHETIRIKSGAWDDSGVFIYSTLNHIKYCLAQGCVVCNRKFTHLLIQVI